MFSKVFKGTLSSTIRLNAIPRATFATKPFYYDLLQMNETRAELRDAAEKFS